MQSVAGPVWPQMVTSSLVHLGDPIGFNDEEYTAVMYNYSTNVGGASIHFQQNLLFTHLDSPYTYRFKITTVVWSHP